MSLSTPVAFLIFKRPDTTKKVFNAIRQAKPKKLLVIADGARPDKPGEAEKCAETRAIIDRVDWDCEVLKRYSDTNLGCGINVSQGISWVFEQVEEAIIIEDDCLPHPTFFLFCQQLLEQYRNDERIMSIGGTNYLREWKRENQSYHFSQFPGIWGWATWRRAWKLYDYEMKTFPAALEKHFLEGFFAKPEHTLYWEHLFERLFNDKNKMNTWDYQWQFARWIQNGLGITPEVNLVSNLGFREDGTHTFGESPFANIEVEAIDFPLKHPSLMLRDLEMDELIQEKFFGKYIKPNLKDKVVATSKAFVKKIIRDHILQNTLG